MSRLGTSRRGGSRRRFTQSEALQLYSPSGSPTPQTAPSVAPAFAPVPLFTTEQIYIANRDGYDLKPLTGREGLIYFYFSWAPDNHALVALACKENEWGVREREFKQPVGRPRLLDLEGRERLLDDRSTEALPVWSPDAAKVATAFDTEVGIYDAATSRPTQARVPLREVVKGFCEILGLDPLYLANEGRLVAVVPPDEAPGALAAMRGHPLGTGACRIGQIVERRPGQVVMHTVLGGQRIVDMLVGDQLPRIC